MPKFCQPAGQHHDEDGDGDGNGDGDGDATMIIARAFHSPAAAVRNGLVVYSQGLLT